MGRKNVRNIQKTKKNFWKGNFKTIRGEISPLKALRKITAIKVFRCNLIYKESMYVMYKKI